MCSKKRRSPGLRLEEPPSAGIREKKIQIVERKKEWPPQKERQEKTWESVLSRKARF